MRKFMSFILSILFLAATSVTINAESEPKFFNFENPSLYNNETSLDKIESLVEMINDSPKKIRSYRYIYRQTVPDNFTDTSSTKYALYNIIQAESQGDNKTFKIKGEQSGYNSFGEIHAKFFVNNGTAYYKGKDGKFEKSNEILPEQYSQVYIELAKLSDSMKFYETDREVIGVLLDEDGELSDVLSDEENVLSEKGYKKSTEVYVRIDKENGYITDYVTSLKLNGVKVTNTSINFKDFNDTKINLVLPSEILDDN